jgi:hypothetical protein
MINAGLNVFDRTAGGVTFDPGVFYELPRDITLAGCFHGESGDLIARHRTLPSLGVHLIAVSAGKRIGKKPYPEFSEALKGGRKGNRTTVISPVEASVELMSKGLEVLTLAMLERLVSYTLINYLDGQVEVSNGQ